MTTIRLQAALSRAGITSRRKARELIEEGRVMVGGKVVREAGYRLDTARERVLVDGVPLRGKKPCVYVLLNKPRGVVTTLRDRHARRTVADLVSVRGHRIFPVGRLDKMSEGLLLLTDDGELAFRLTHPRFGVMREYRVVVSGALTRRTERLLEQGVVIDGERTAPCSITVEKKEPKTTVATVRLGEGRKRQIRRMFEMAGHPVVSLRRIAFGSLTLGKIEAGSWQFLTERQITGLRKDVGLE